jgi:uncharacterized phage protein gp47/JayE
MAEITPQGYILKTQNEYYSEEEQLYLDIDADWNLDPSTPDGLKLAHDAEIFANLDEQLLLAYNSKDPNKARGIELDAIAAITNTFRNQGTPSQVSLDLTGVDGTVIPAGSLVESVVDESKWATDSEVTIAGGVASVTATNQANGAVQANAETITKIVTTIGGWQTVTNPTVANVGTNPDTDAELRLERQRAVAQQGSNQVDSMIGAILSTEGVRQVLIYENDTDLVDINGLPAHSIAPIVDGGTDYDVALAIYLKKTLGVFLHQAGTPVSVLVTSPIYPQQTKIINYSRPIDVPIIVAIEIIDDGTLPINADELITQAIIDYTQGELLPEDTGFNSTGFGIGQTVVLSRLYTPINNVIGEYGNSYVSSLTLNGSPSNVSINFNELSQFAEGNITVVIL